MGDDLSSLIKENKNHFLKYFQFSGELHTITENKKGITIVTKKPHHIICRTIPYNEIRGWANKL